jgi:hypothetical protein
MDGKIGCFTFVSTSPGGPYHLARKNWGLMVFNQRGHDPEYAYYNRFFHNGEAEVLTNYQVYDGPHWHDPHKHDPHYNHTEKQRVYLAPLKKLIVDPDDGVTLRMVWWPPNEKLKRALSISAVAAPPESATMHLSADSGAIVEGKVRWGDEGGLCFPYNQSGGRWKAGGSAQFVAGFIRFNATTMSVGESFHTSCSCSDALTVNDTLGITTGAGEPSRSLAIALGEQVRFRLMFRRGMFEVYLNDHFVSSYALHVPSIHAAVDSRTWWAGRTQELQLVGAWAGATNVSAWEMGLGVAVHRG